MATRRPSRDTLTRREFLRQTTALGAGLVTGIALSRSPLSADGAPAKVALSQNPNVFRPDGAVDTEALRRLINKALQALTGQAASTRAWQSFFRPTDVVGLKVHARPVPTSLPVVDAIITSLTNAGIKPGQIIIFDQEDADLFRAGYGLSRSANQVRCYGNDSAGFNGSISRIVAEEVTAWLNVPTLMTHPKAGMAAAMMNHLGLVRPDVAKAQELNGYADLGAVCAEPRIASKRRLTIVDALRPYFGDGLAMDPEFLWRYGGVLVSEDVVATDAVARRILEDKRRDYRGADWPLTPQPVYIDIADHRYGLGQSSLDHIELVAVGQPAPPVA
jgi:hypothetical protein